MTEEINKKIKELEEKIVSLESELRKEEEGISEGASESISKDSKNNWVLIESDNTIIKSRPDSGDQEIVSKELEKMDWKEIHAYANKFRKKI